MIIHPGDSNHQNSKLRILKSVFSCFFQVQLQSIQLAEKIPDKSIQFNHKDSLFKPENCSAYLHSLLISAEQMKECNITLQHL